MIELYNLTKESTKCCSAYWHGLSKLHWGHYANFRRNFVNIISYTRVLFIEFQSVLCLLLLPGVQINKNVQYFHENILYL